MTPLRSPARVGVALVVAVAAGFICVYFFKGLHLLDGLAANNSAISFADREVAGGNSIVVDQSAAYEARALIPPNERYRVVTGGTVTGATSLTAPFVADWYRYFLMHRRPAADAKWIVCYACDVAKLGGAYSVRWSDQSGISIGQLR